MKTTHPATPAFNAFGIIGLGLIGGSLAKALRAFVPGCRITVADLRPEPVHAALAEGVADATKSAAGELLGNHPLYPGLEL